MQPPVVRMRQLGLGQTLALAAATGRQLQQAAAVLRLLEEG